MKINKDETKIVGQWIFDGSNMLADDQCTRIDWLTNNYLLKISEDESGWLKFYQDLEDKRYWQLNFEHGELQSGGPSSLIFQSESEAKDKYNI